MFTDEAETTIESLRSEVKAMDINFKKLEADVSIVKNVSNFLMKKSVEIQRQVLEKCPVL